MADGWYGDIQYRLRLYVAGEGGQSEGAVASIRATCEDRLAGRYELEVIDIRRDPERASADGILAVPTLVKELPPPVRQLVGDFSDRSKLLVGLGLSEAGH